MSSALPDRVSDEVWQRLDRSAGRLSRGGRARFATGLGAGLVLIIAAGLTWYSGLLVPQLAMLDRVAHGSADGDVVISLTMANRGRFPVTVRSAGPTGPGVELQRVEAPWPITLRPGDQVGLTYVYRVIDCAAVSRDAWVPEVVVDRSWGPPVVTLLGTRNDLTWPRLARFHCGP